MQLTELEDNEITLQESSDDEKWLVVNAAAGLLCDVALLV